MLEEGRRLRRRTRLEKALLVKRILVWLGAITFIIFAIFAYSQRDVEEKPKTISSVEVAQPVQVIEAVQVEYKIAPKEVKPVVSEYVERVVAAESRGESLEGQMAVAQCIRTTAEATGQTPEQVVKVPNQYAQPVSASEVTDSVREACYRVFYIGESAVDEDIRYFYSTNGDFYSRWHEENLEYVTTIGGHKFFK